MLTEKTERINLLKALPHFRSINGLPDASWVPETTAILIVHGIGHQQPIETLDMFSRGLIAQYQRLFPGSISFDHQLYVTEEGAFQNVIRLKNNLKPDVFIDIYEYYWAYCTQDKANLSDINNWLQGVVDGAQKYYSQNEDLGKRSNDESIFFRNGKFIHWKYDLFLNFVTKTCLFLNFFISGILKLIGFIPYVGGIAKSLLKKFFDSSIYKLSNLIGDIVIYNVTDEKSKFYPVRKQILQGATDVLKYLIEKEVDDALCYPTVYVAGHSLGSQIAYDAINKVNLLANTNQLKYYKANGEFNSIHNLKNAPASLACQLRGLITFGSPLDKIAFFLRQVVGEQQFIWQQIISKYYCFRQGDWFRKLSPNKTIGSSSIERILEDIQWINYYDDDDIISGRLDYYKGLTNVNCRFNCNEQFKEKKSNFTHSHYWDCEDFYEDIIRGILSGTDNSMVGEKMQDKKVQSGTGSTN
jgi:hypothetical protein